MNKIGFYLSHKDREISSINMVVRFKGKHFKIPAGVSVKKEFWNKQKKLSRECREYKDGYHVNAKLNSFEIATRAVLQDFDLKNELPTPKQLSVAISDYMKPESESINLKGVTDYIYSFIENTNRSLLTIKRYKTTLNKLKEYEKLIGKKLEWSDMDMNFYNSFQSFLYRKVVSLNYFGDIIKNVKMFHKSAFSDGIHNHTLPDKFRTISEDSDSIYLTSDELKKLHELNINEDLILDAMSAKILNVTGNLERMIVSLKDCRDRFLIGAYTAMRFSDYAFLSGVSYKDNFISRVSQKTGVKTVIPMHPVIRGILQARVDMLPPKISNQKMNDQLKVLCKLAKINSPFEVTITKGGRKVRTVYEKWELATTHTARRSGATNMFLAGIDPISIMSFSGHKTVKSFMKYIKASAIDTAEKLKDHAFFK